MAVQVSESDQIKQFKEFLGTYNKVTENCFMDCVKDFTTRDVKAEELLGDVSAEVPEDDPADLHALPGVPHPAERGSGGEVRTAGPASLKGADPEPDSFVYKVFDMYDIAAHKCM
ncbi:mitochondrial import inner membrane translocase subunit Tim9 isoform X1 [Takifugu rubripes]|uniref:mitochondrial import inner membrane translocase subunit Tim9 isoform X1 n=1 Tax=Takifugu rubripes TaxID=31033 RepID=UPI0011451E9B|nr:mitochondrial import inner membrane translocase subunit Tim9 isoform X1 [Takifugu rubripes]XP_029688851.1 mitochondrial import inner membrane translocase subunit Tim9 isoform X1 [Takifugu rubripes]XP_029688852.1 mitochondrial import inner membrane translocase subunit Tim9 isoform X1 [Takifugu rubripes]XP_029688853.1 mitochondrial import inner membrane translocase subunit Tim9 isoform X1 [Takifugu rubripes]